MFGFVRFDLSTYQFSPLTKVSKSLGDTFYLIESISVSSYIYMFEESGFQAWRFNVYTQAVEKLSSLAVTQGSFIAVPMSPECGRILLCGGKFANDTVSDQCLLSSCLPINRTTSSPTSAPLATTSPTALPTFNPSYFPTKFPTDGPTTTSMPTLTPSLVPSRLSSKITEISETQSHSETFSIKVFSWP